MRLPAKCGVCLVMAALAVIIGCESSDDGSSESGGTLPGSWSWSSLTINSSQLSEPLVVTPAILAALGKTITLNGTFNEDGSFSATIVIPDLSDLQTFLTSLGYNVPDSALALAGTYNLNGTWSTDSGQLTLVTPDATYVLPYTLSGNALEITIPESLVEQITGQTGTTLTVTLTRT